MDTPATTLADYQREVLRRGFREALAQGQVRPLLLPWCLVPSFVLPALYLALPHVGGSGGGSGGSGGGSRSDNSSLRRNLLRAARLPLAAAIVALNVNMLWSPWWPPVSSLNMASAYATGLIVAWGTQWALTVLVWTDPQRDAERVERWREEGVRGGSVGRQQKDRKDQKERGQQQLAATDASVAQSLREGFTYRWQAFPADAPYLTRLDWALDLCLAGRGTGWNWCIAQLPRFPPPSCPRTAEPVRLDAMAIRTAAGFRRHRSYAAFVSMRLLAVVVGYLVLDVAAVLVTVDPYFVLGPPPDPTHPWSEQTHHLVHLASPASSASPPPPALFSLPPALALVYRHPALLPAYRATLCIVGIVAALYMYLSLSQLAQVLLLGRLGPLRWLTGAGSTRAELWHYPSIFGGLDQVLDHGLAGFWGSLWHQTFRVIFVAPTSWLVHVGVLAKPSRSRSSTTTTTTTTTTTRTVGILVAFFQSAVLHAAGTYTSAGRARTRWWQQPLFFVLAAVGIAVQHLLCRRLLAPAARRLGLCPSPSCRRAGNLFFAAAWLLATHPLFVDDLCRCGGWLFEPVPFSPLRWALGGAGPNDPPAGSNRAGNAAWRWYDDDLPYWHVGEHWWNTGLAI